MFSRTLLPVIQSWDELKDLQIDPNEVLQGQKRQKPYAKILMISQAGAAGTSVCHGGTSIYLALEGLKPLTDKR